MSAQRHPILRWLALFAVLLGVVAVAVTRSLCATAPTTGSACGYDGPTQHTVSSQLETRVASVAAFPRDRPSGAICVGRALLVVGVAAEGAQSAISGVGLRAQLAGKEIAGGHAFEKHILDLGEFPGIRTRAQFASHIEGVILKGEMRPLSGGRTAYWREGTVVIRNPRAADGGTAFQPRDGYDYFLGLH